MRFSYDPFSKNGIARVEETSQLLFSAPSGIGKQLRVVDPLMNHLFNLRDSDLRDSVVNLPFRLFRLFRPFRDGPHEVRL
jgi:hypothetical protein